MLLFVSLACVVIGIFDFAVQFGLVSDAAELAPVLNSNGGLYVLAGLCLAGLLVWNLFIYRRYLLLLTVVKTFRATILQHLRNLMPRTPTLCFAPRTAHGSRAPPFAC